MYSETLHKAHIHSTTEMYNAFGLYKIYTSISL